MAAIPAAPDRGSRLAVLRRIYLYAVAFYSLTFLQTSIRDLGRHLGLLWSRPADSPLLTRALPIADILEQSSFAFVAVLFFAVHWTLAQGFVPRLPGERASFWRKLFLWLTVAVALYFASAHTAELVRWPLLIIWRPADFAAFTWNSAVASLPGLILAGAVLWRFVPMIYQEREAGADSRLVGVGTGLWFAILATVALGLLIASANEGLYLLLSDLVFRLVPVVSGATPMVYVLEAAAIGWVALGVLMYLEPFRTRVVQGQWPTQTSSLHVAWLYLGQLVGIVLIAVGMIRLLESLLPELGPNRLPDRLDALIALPLASGVGLACWLWFRREAQRTDERRRAGPWRAFLRQIHLYVLAVLGLIWIARGCAGIIDHFLNRAVWAGMEGPGDALWTSVSELVVAIPLLALTWRVIAAATAQGHGPDALPLTPWPRRVYLYGVTLVATLSLLVLTGQVLNDLLQWWVYPPSLDRRGWQSAGEAGTQEIVFTSWSPLGSFTNLDWIAVMAVMLLIHLLILRRDRQYEAQTPSPSPAARTALLQELDQLRSREARIQDRMAEVRQALQEIDETMAQQGEATES